MISALSEMNWTFGEPYIAAENTLSPMKTHKMLMTFGKNKRAFENVIYSNFRKRIPGRIVVYFYDLPAIDFEKIYGNDVDFRNITEDTPSKKASVVMGLVTDENFLPLGFDLFLGKRARPMEMLATVKRVQEVMQVDSITIVSDRGLNDAETLKEIDRLGFDYVFGTKIVSSTEGLDKKIFNDEGYTMNYDPNTGDLIRKYLEIPGSLKYASEPFPLKTKNSLTLYYSPKLSSNDRHAREKMIWDEFYRCSLSFLRGGAGRSAPIEVEVLNNENFSSNLFEYLKNQRFSGYRVLIHSNPNLNREHLCRLYSNYWKMSFLSKLFKKYFDQLPSLHWTYESIRGGFMLCFVNVMAQMMVEYAAKMAGFNASTEEVVTTIRNANVTVLRHGEEFLFVKTKTPPLFDAVSNLMGLEPLNTIETLDSFAKKMKLSPKELRDITNRLQ